MNLNTYARIGKGIITKAIGLQKNYKEEYIKGIDKLNPLKSCCDGCEYHTLKKMYAACGTYEEEYKKILETNCSTCPKAVWETSYEVHYKYINEKNKYGYQPTLKTNAIKLLLAYHFLQPDINGVVKNVNIKDLAALIGCTISTIRSSNQILVDYGYCYTCNSGISDHCINIMLPEYKLYHKPANEGGRGYFTMSKDMFKGILSLKYLNTLRLNLRGILEVDNVMIQDIKNTSTPLPVSTSYKKLSYFLPVYCKRNIIKKALSSQENPLFHLVLNENTVVFHIKEQYTHKKLREEMLQESEDTVKTYIQNLNDVLKVADSSKAGHAHGADIRIDNLLSLFHINDYYFRYPPLELEEADYKDLASMYIQYAPDLVNKAISIAYNSFILQNKPIDCYGALIRHIIRNMSIYRKVS